MIPGTGTTESMPTPEDILDRTRAEGLAELTGFLRIPSISSQPEHAGDVRAAADHLADLYTHIGLENAEVIDTAGHPVVYAEWLNAPDKPTVLVYGHYDVQPVDPLDLWTSPPFEPVEQDGLLLARGSSDDKGQIAIHWQAVRAWLQATGGLPVNLKMIAEGEEEIGSPHFEAFVQSHRDLLRAGACVVSDTSLAARDVPAVTYGLRGLLYFELRVESANSDLHSGLFGGIAPNPAQALSEIIAKLKDPSGRVLVPGFYDGVRPLTDEERRQFARVPFDEVAFRQTYAIEALEGEPGFTPNERNWGRPSLDVNGIWGGYQGPGSKTIIPGWAAAKISCRLVPDQDPRRVAGALRTYIEAIRPRSVRATLTEVEGHGGPWITPIDHPLMQAGKRALQRAYGTEPVFIRSGGSIGAVDAISRQLDIPCLLVGFVLPDCRAHAPNESLDLASYDKGRRAVVELWRELGSQPESIGLGP
jgi:acetylornithine deacetylase/succinyl-diaminopimelate desuccinylase-like protein